MYSLVKGLGGGVDDGADAVLVAGPLRDAPAAGGSCRARTRSWMKSGLNERGQSGWAMRSAAVKARRLESPTMKSSKR
jgi:hypothetical protein